MSAASKNLGTILGVSPELLEGLEAAHQKKGILESVDYARTRRIRETCQLLGVKDDFDSVRQALAGALITQEKGLLSLVENAPGGSQFEKAAALAREITPGARGLFLKKELGKDILEKCPPLHVLEFLKYKTVAEMLENHDVTEVFSALRFLESDAWMHETFDAAYGEFGAPDFEEREIEIRVLGPEWWEVAARFVAKKHHNVSHLKEFGVIFLNPVREDGPGKFMRDFSLIFHYFNEIQFYSLLFKKYLDGENFGGKFKSLLRGDIVPPPTSHLPPSVWLIVQRYLFKENPADPRLFLPRINPESVHWYRGERNLADFSVARPILGLGLWRGMDWVAQVYEGQENPLSFDLEDTAMSTVSHAEGKSEAFFYHQREALWTKLFIEFAGGEKEMERLLVDNFDKGSIQL